MHVRILSPCAYQKASSSVPARLETTAERGRTATADLDRRSRLPDALDAALRTPALTLTLLARHLHTAPQTATALLRDLLAAGLVREVTGRKHFRAFAA